MNYKILSHRKRSRRLRKKLRVGEFQELGFEVSFQLRPGLSEEERDKFWESFILDGIERNELIFGGGTDGFVALPHRGSATDAHRDIIRSWLSARPEVASVVIGPLVDAWHLSEETQYL